MATGQVYTQNPQSKATLDKALTEAQQNAIVLDNSREVLDKKKCLEIVANLEKRKVELTI
jgi:hypothetical protein